MNASADLYMTALKMFSALAVVLALLWGGLYILRKFIRNNGKVGGTKLIRVIDSRYLTAKSSIALVEIPGSILVVGIGQEHINLLDKIDTPQQLAEFKSEISQGNSSSLSGQFHRIFSELRTKKRVES
jgi:flagellar biosynthetic protein FliO